MTLDFRIAFTGSDRASLTELIESRGSSLCMDNAEDRRALVELIGDWLETVTFHGAAFDAANDEDTQEWGPK